MSSCVGFDVGNFNDCDGWEWWAGYDEHEECFGSVTICLCFCDDFTSLIGFDDDSVMESMDEDCNEECEFDCGACAGIFWTGVSMVSHTCGNDSYVIIIIL